jgi:diguanylate cyclase (GGDEF)-like protein
MRRIVSRMGSGSRLLVDIAVIFGIAALLRVLTFDLELFERFAEFSQAHENWEMDELLVTVAILSAALLVFGVRRIQDQRRELALRVAAERHATMLALHDPLTGLPNRRRLREAVAEIASTPGRVDALMILDLDGFKPINDVFGHPTGDEALRVVGKRLGTLSEAGIFCARLGGDEFALLVRDRVSCKAVEAVAAEVIAAIEAPLSAGGVQHRLQVSIGIAALDLPEVPPEEYLRRADVALYRAKTLPGSAHVVYEPAMDASLQQRIALERDLREALATGAVLPHYQPIVDLASGRVLKLEALARWRHPELGDVPPARFIPLAEERGLILPLTEQLLRRALSDALLWPGDIVLSVNLSPLLLVGDGFVRRLTQILAAAAFPPRRLELEVTESALGSDIEPVRAVLESLRQLGVRIALDDFGTGYSNLSRLRGLPFDELKIDASFVRSMSASPENAVIVRTIVDLGHGLGMQITAEGVEDQEQRAALIADGCRHGQGFLFSKAIPADQVTALLASQDAPVEPRLERRWA